MFNWSFPILQKLGIMQEYNVGVMGFDSQEDWMIYGQNLGEGGGESMDIPQPDRGQMRTRSFEDYDRDGANLRTRTRSFDNLPLGRSNANTHTYTRSFSEGENFQNPYHRRITNENIPRYDSETQHYGTKRF